jgi:hypothetical protein
MVQPGSISAVVDLNSTELVVVGDDRPVCGRRVNNAAGIDIIYDRLDNRRSHKSFSTRRDRHLGRKNEHTETKQRRDSN